MNNPGANFTVDHETDKSMIPHGLLAHVTCDADTEQEWDLLKKRLRCKKYVSTPKP